MKKTLKSYYWYYRIEDPIYYTQVNRICISPMIDGTCFLLFVPKKTICYKVESHAKRCPMNNDLLVIKAPFGIRLSSFVQTCLSLAAL